MIYLDNAATSYPKPENVYMEMNRCLREYCANPGRGGHAMSITSGRAVMKARETVASLFNVKAPLRLCFTKNATEALNLAIRGYLAAGSHVITTSMEHNSVIRPLKTLERDMGIELTIVPGGDWGEVDPQDILKAIRRNTKLIVCTLSSNVNGMFMPVSEIGRIAEEKGIAFLLDASQGAGAFEINVETLKIDMLAFPGHKGLLGPQGTGGLYVKEGIRLRPLFQGGTGSNSENTYQPEFMPDVLESGTLNTPGIIGLASGVEFIRQMGISNISTIKNYLTQRLHEGLQEIPRLKLYSTAKPGSNSGIAAFNLIGMDSTEVSGILDKDFGIATRAGLHCAPLAHQTLGTQESGIVRMSIGCFNTIEEIDAAIHAVRSISLRLKSS